MSTKCKESVSLVRFVSHVNKSKNKLAVKISKHDLAVNVRVSPFGVQKRLKLLNMCFFVFVIESIKPSDHILTKTFFSHTIIYNSVLTLIAVREIPRLHTVASLRRWEARAHLSRPSPNFRLVRSP